jgi:glutathione S-transferase
MKQNNNYRLVGRPESGYTLKVQSALRFKEVRFEWMDRFKNEAIYQQHAKVQLIPLLLLADGSTMHDSTPILEMLEAKYPEFSMHPLDPALRFLSEVLEEYGDEWINKLIFHYRWGYPADWQSRGTSISNGVIESRSLGWAAHFILPFVKRRLIKRMLPRMALAGANANNAPILTQSFAQLTDLLEVHLQNRLYLFGERPAFGDFGLLGQMWQAHTDPNCGKILTERTPLVVAWIKRMDHPRVEGDFETLKTTLQPIFAHQIAPYFLAWNDANAKAFAASNKQTELQMGKRRYYQKIFKYPAGSLAILRSKLKAASSDTALTNFLEATHCLTYLKPQ